MLTDLEERLAGPQGAVERVRLLAELGALEQRLQGRLRQLQPRDAFEQAQAALAATRAASKVLQAWCVGVNGAASNDVSREAQPGCMPRPRLS
jgi:hypothetical protein